MHGGTLALCLHEWSRARMCASRSCTHDEDGGERDGGADEGRDEERNETPFSPLHLRTPHRLDDLLPLVLGLRRLPVRRRLQRREQNEGPCYPE